MVDVDNKPGAPEADAVSADPTQEDPVVALQRTRRRKRRAWWLGLAALAVGGAVWAVYAHWPLPTIHIWAEVDVTCPMQVSGRVDGDDDRRTGFPSFIASPLPDTPGRTFVFEADGAPKSTVEIRAEVPTKRGWDASRCGRTACRIYADGELVFEGLTTAGRSLTCLADTRDRSPLRVVSRRFATPLTVPAYAF